MKKPQNVLFGSAIKSTVAEWDLDSDVGWTALSGAGSVSGVDMFFRYVPWLYRGTKDRAANVSTMPWSIMLKNKEVATSAEWSDKKPDDLDWLSNPKKLFYQIEQSLTVTGRAYVFLEVNPGGYIKAARYCAPTTITEVYNPETGALDRFERRINGRVVNCLPAADPRKTEKGWGRMVAIYDADYLTEDSHPAGSSAALAALCASGVLFSSARFVEKFFSRGAIKASILSLDSGSQTEADRLQSWWEDVIGGIRNAWSALVLRAKLAAPIVIGEGLESLQNDSLTTANRQDICTALGVPESRLWSSAANYATRDADEKAYFRGTIIPEFDLIAEALNDQVFIDAHNLAGYRIEGQPETLDVFQVEENERSGSLVQLASIIPVDLAMEILGYDLTEAQWARVRVKEVEPVVTQEAPAIPAAQAEPTQPIAAPDQIKELEIWQRKAIKAMKAGGSANCEFTAATIDPDHADDIRAALTEARTIEDVKAVFADRLSGPIDPWLREAQRLSAALESLNSKGAEGSGNFGHEGRPGEIGGSGGGGGSSDLLPKAKRIRAKDVEPVNPITDKNKFKDLVVSMQDNGWVGDPILTYQDGETIQAITGSHRVYAAREAEIEVPTMMIDTSNFSEEDVDRFLNAQKDEDVLDFFVDANSRGIISDDELTIMKKEVAGNDAPKKDKYKAGAAEYDRRKKEKQKENLSPSNSGGKPENKEGKEKLDTFNARMKEKYKNPYEEMTDEEISTIERLEKEAYKK